MFARRQDINLLLHEFNPSFIGRSALIRRPSSGSAQGGQIMTDLWYEGAIRYEDKSRLLPESVKMNNLHYAVTMHVYQVYIIVYSYVLFGACGGVSFGNAAAEEISESIKMFF